MMSKVMSWQCIVPDREVQRINEKYIVSNLRNSGEDVTLRIISELQPMNEAKNIEVTLEDAYLYHTQTAGGRKSAVV